MMPRFDFDQAHELPRENHPQQNRAFVSGLLGVLVCVNAPLFLMARADSSWGALGIALAIGPAVNGVVLLLAWPCLWLLRRRKKSRVGRFPIAVALLPILFAVGLAIAIMSMDLRSS